MALYRHSSKEAVKSVKEAPFKLERELQAITEKNLTEIFGLDFVATQFEHNDLRIDTLAFDPDKKSFVIIEYKREKSFSVIDQGFAYLSLLLNHQAEFVLKYNQVNKDKKGKSDFDWSQTRVMFLTRSFTTHQLEAINFRDLPIELWEVTNYEGGLIQYSQIKKAGAKASIESLGISDKEVEKISKEVRNYSEDGYVESRSKGKGKELYWDLKEKLTALGEELEIHPTKYYIAFRSPSNWRNIFAVHVFKDKLYVELTRSKPKDFKDPEKKVWYKKDSFKFFHQHISAIEVINKKDVDYSIYILQQAVERFKRK